jgi:hypothetical protein
MHRAFGRKLLGQKRPLAAGFEDVADCIETSSRGVGIAPGTTPTFGLREVDERLEQLPFGIAQIGVVARPLVG